MTQTNEIIELKRRLLNTATQLEQGTCADQEQIDKMAYPVVHVNELPNGDDNVFHKDEELSIFVGIRADKKVTPIPLEPVAVFYADGSKDWKLTGEDGTMKLKKPRAVGKTAYDVPNIFLYSEGKSFYVVE